MKQLSPAQIVLMKKAGEITKNALLYAETLVKPGVTTNSLDNLISEYIINHGGKPCFKGYNGFPKATCISVNEVVVHGIPSQRKLKEGDIVSIDIGATFEGFVGDNAWTFPCGDVSKEAQSLIDATREALFEGIAAAKAGNRIGDIGSAVQRYVEARGYSVVRSFVGHGVGAKMHEDPAVPNYGTPGRGVRLLPGMTIAIEPMINEGVKEVETLKDGWTTVTADGKLSAHFEHTVAVTPDGPVILTLPD